MKSYKNLKRAGGNVPPVPSQGNTLGSASPLEAKAASFDKHARFATLIAINKAIQTAYRTVSFHLFLPAGG